MKRIFLAALLVTSAVASYAADKPNPILQAQDKQFAPVVAAVFRAKNLCLDLVFEGRRAPGFKEKLKKDGWSEEHAEQSSSASTSFCKKSDMGEVIARVAYKAGVREAGPCHSKIPMKCEYARLEKYALDPKVIARIKSMMRSDPVLSAGYDKIVNEGTIGTKGDKANFNSALDAMVAKHQK